MITIDKCHGEAIKQVCQAASSRSTIQAFENVMIKSIKDGIEMKAGDSLIEITRTIPAAVESGFETTVNAAKFLQAFTACGGDVTLICKDDLTVKSGRRKFNLPIISVESYPAYPEMGDSERIDCDGIVKKIKAASWASAKDDVRHVFNGVFIGEHAVATNGHKMAMVNLGLNRKAIVPINSIQKMPDIDGIIMISDSIFCIKGDDLTFKTKLIDGQFPDYTRAIPKTNKTVTVKTADFIDAVKAAAITANSKFKTVIFRFGKESTVESLSQDKRESSLIGFDCDTSDDFDFAVNSAYLIEAASSLSSESLEIKFSDMQMMIESDDHKAIISAVRA